MKRDWDLIRKLLADIEEDKDLLAELPSEPKLEDLSWEEYGPKNEEYKAVEGRICGHLEMLIENGYIDGLKIHRSSGNNFTWSISSPRLTMAGHDLLDTMRSSSVCSSIKSIAKDKGIELTFDAIKALGSVALKQLTA